MKLGDREVAQQLSTARWSFTGQGSVLRTGQPTTVSYSTTRGSDVLLPPYVPGIHMAYEHIRRHNPIHVNNYVVITQ